MPDNKNPDDRGRDDRGQDGTRLATTGPDDRGPDAPLGARRLAGFALLAVATGGINIPIQIYLPAFYATAVGLDLATIGLVFMVSRLISVGADPVIGWASDRTRSRIGRRKPWILGGGLLTLVGIAAVFFPPAGAGPAWLAASLVLLGIGWTAATTPHVTWGGELAKEPTQRSRIQAYLMTGSSLGIFLVLLAPAVLDFVSPGGPERRVYAMGALLGTVLAAGLVAIAVLFRERPATPTLGPQWRHLGALARDGELVRIIASDFCVAVGQGLRGALFLFFATRYIGVASPALLLMLQYAFGILAGPIWARISYRLGLRRTLIVAELAQVTVNVLALALAPGQQMLFAVLVVGQGLLQGSGNLMLRSMIYGVADRHRDRGAGEVAGLLSSVFNVTTNAGFAMAVGIGLPVLAWLGFDPRASGTAGVDGLHVFFALGPALGHLLSVAIIRWGRRPSP